MKAIIRTAVSAAAFALLYAPGIKAIPVAIDTRVVTQLVDGDLTRSVIVITNTDDTQNATYHVDFYGDNGQPLKFPITNIGSVDHLDRTLAPGASKFLTTPGAAPVQRRGSARREQARPPLSQCPRYFKSKTRPLENLIAKRSCRARPISLAAVW